MLRLRCTSATLAGGFAERVVIVFASQFASLRDDSVAALERALRLKAEDLGKEVDMAERLVVRLRDCLIEWIRLGDSAGHRWQTAFYPAGGIQRSLLEQARESLKALQADAD